MQRHDFAYDLPPELIAQTPLAERSASRLLVVEPSAEGSADAAVYGVSATAPMALRDCAMRDFPSLLRPGDLLVFNDTKVVAARLVGTKPSGGRVEIFLERVSAEAENEALVQLRASKPIREGLEVTTAGGIVRILGRQDDLWRVGFPGSALEFFEKWGDVPLPPYIHRAPDANDRERYQSIFARERGAVAAPTASLHFDSELTRCIEEMGVSRAFVTLHVGAGTFQPVRIDDLDAHVMHAERVSVSAATCGAIERTRAAGGRVIAIGTTVIRALESAALATAVPPRGLPVATTGGGTGAFAGDAGRMGNSTGASASDGGRIGNGSGASAGDSGRTGGASGVPAADCERAGDRTSAADAARAGVVAAAEAVAIADTGASARNVARAEDATANVAAIAVTHAAAAETPGTASHRPCLPEGGWSGETRLFIRPGFNFQVADALLTNFHLPESTLLMLVCAFAGTPPVLAAYEHAVREKYRFFSYGDAMFLTRARANVQPDAVAVPVAATAAPTTAATTTAASPAPTGATAGAAAATTAETAATRAAPTAATATVPAVATAPAAIAATAPPAAAPSAPAPAITTTKRTPG